MIIEQAKGVIAERSTVGMATAFDLLRSAARAQRRPLSELAAEVAQGPLSRRRTPRPTGDRRGPQTTERSRPSQ